MNCTIDASVFVAAARAPEAHHAASLEFLRLVEGQTGNLFCPTLVLDEDIQAVLAYAAEVIRQDILAPLPA